MNRIQQVFQKRSKKVIPFFTAGYPRKEDTLEMVMAAESAGASMVEIGMPFSDPLADGPIIQQSSQIALNNGEVLFPAATLLIIPEYTDQTIRQLRFLGLKTQDPKERYTKALQLLSAKFYQNSEDFSGSMSGIFPQSSKEVEKLDKNRYCVTTFDYQQQTFKIPCHVCKASKNDSV